MPGLNSAPAERAAAYERATMTAKEAATYLGISYWLVLEMVKRGSLKSIRAGSRVLFRKSALDDWMASQEAGTGSQEQGYGQLRRAK